MADGLAALREARNRARATLDGRLRQLRDALDERGIGGRITDDLKAEARQVGAEALDVAKESKAVIAGTVAALALWFFRLPLLGWLQERIDHATGGEKEEQP